jgi:hypothetical protein
MTVEIFIEPTPNVLAAARILDMVRIYRQGSDAWNG